MGKMKEIYMELIENEYKGDYDAYIQDLAKQSCEELKYLDNLCCPNCFEKTLHGNESLAICEACAQEFIFIGNALRFK